MNAAKDVVRRFAEALDESDFDTARNLLDPGCVYLIANERLQGPDSVITSYQSNDEWAQATFDHVVYESTIRDCEGCTAVIEYIDRITHGDNQHIHRCEQLVTVGENGLVEQIEHRDIHGEKETLERFFEEVGVKRGAKR